MVLQSGDDCSTGMLVETLMQQAKERVAEEFLEACEDDEEKRAIVLELCQKVLTIEQYNKILSAERSQEEEGKKEVDTEEDEKNDDENDESDNSDEGSSDESIPTMKEIEDKPYTDGLSAETGELPFEQFKVLLEPDEDRQDDQQEQSTRRSKKNLVPKKEAIDRFGEGDATNLVNWYYNVKHSGQLYSDIWLEGKIRDNHLGEIAKPMLLMCLQDQRISKALSSVLGRICDQLGLQSLVKRALDIWGVAENYPAVWARKPTDQYEHNVKICRQCEIFVARAYVCTTYLKYTSVSTDLGNKLISCFQTMEENLPRHLAKKNAKKKSTDSGRKGTTSSSRSDSSSTSAGNIPADNSTLENQSDEEPLDGMIEQIDPETMEAVGVFSSMQELRERLGATLLKSFSKPHKYIRRVLKANQQTPTYGFIWRYKQTSTSQETNSSATGESKETEINDNQSDGNTETINKRLDKGVSKKSQRSEEPTIATGKTQHVNKDNPRAAETDQIIEQVDLHTGEVLAVFSSIQEIEKKLGHSFTSPNPKKFVNKCLRGDQKSFSGFIWRYKGQTSEGTAVNRTCGENKLVDPLQNTAQPGGKRNASCIAEVFPVSKRAKLHTRDSEEQSADPDGQKKHDSESGIVGNVGGNGVSRVLMRAITSMDDIKESPYLKEENAEVGEETFDTLKNLLLPQGTTGRQLEATQDAKDLWGETLAREMVTANECISKSGMVYGSDWKNGNIQGKRCELPSKHHLLLCLQEQRLASSSTDDLYRIIGDLGIIDMVKVAVEAWKFKSDFPLVTAMKSPSALHSKTKALFGCMIFVARSHSCMEILKKKKVSDSIMKKVRQCLELVHSSLERKQGKTTQQEKSTSAEVTTKKSVQSGGQKDKPSFPQHERPKVAERSTPVEDGRSAEPVEDGFVMHNLFLKPARVSAETLKKKPKPMNEPKRPANPANSSSTGPVTTNRVEGEKSATQNSSQNQPTNQTANKNLQTNQRTQSKPASKPPQLAVIPNRPAKDNCPSANQQKPIATPTHKQPTDKSQPSSRAHVEPPTPASALAAPSLTPVQPTNNVELPPIEFPPNGSWYSPDDILSPTETELAWLTTECSFALRLNESSISWPFIFQYASPSLKMELRKGEPTMDKLVRLHDGFVRKRFEFLKGSIERDLNRGKRRPLMEQIIPLLRRASRLANTGRGSVATTI